MWALAELSLFMCRLSADVAFDVSTVLAEISKADLIVLILIIFIFVIIFITVLHLGFSSKPLDGVWNDVIPQALPETRNENITQPSIYWT